MCSDNSAFICSHFCCVSNAVHIHMHAQRVHMDSAAIWLIGVLLCSLHRWVWRFHSLLRYTDNILCIYSCYRIHLNAWGIPTPTWCVCLAPRPSASTLFISLLAHTSHSPGAAVHMWYVCLLVFPLHSQFCSCRFICWSCDWHLHSVSLPSSTLWSLSAGSLPSVAFSQSTSVIISGALAILIITSVCSAVKPAWRKLTGQNCFINLECFQHLGIFSNMIEISSFRLTRYSWML